MKAMRWIIRLRVRSWAGKVLNDGSLTLALYYRLKNYQLSYNGNASGVSNVPPAVCTKVGVKLLFLPIFR